MNKTNREILSVRYVFNVFGEPYHMFFNYGGNYYGRYSIYSNIIRRSYIGDMPNSADSEVIQYLNSVGLEVKK